MENINNSTDTGNIINETFNDNLHSFFLVYSPEEVRLCLENVFKGYLGSDLCTKNLPRVREEAGIILMDFMDTLRSGE